MLAEDDKMLETFKDKVDFLGEFLVQDGQLEAARFMLVLRGMLDHEVGAIYLLCQTYTYASLFESVCLP